MSASRGYFIHHIRLAVLSDRPIDEFRLEDLNYLVTEGDCVLHTFSSLPTEVSAKKMADLLYEAGSEPGFFQLDDDGNKSK